MIFSPSQFNAMLFSRKRHPVPAASYFWLDCKVPGHHYIALLSNPGLSIRTSSASKPKSLLDWWIDMNLHHSLPLHCYCKTSLAVCKPDLGSISTEGAANSWKFTDGVCLKLWDLSYQAMFRAFTISNLAAHRKQIKLCTFFSYMNGLSFAPIAN